MGPIVRLTLMGNGGYVQILRMVVQVRASIRAMGYVQIPLPST